MYWEHINKCEYIYRETIVGRNILFGYMYDLTAYDISSRDICILMDVDKCARRFPCPELLIPIDMFAIELYNNYWVEGSVIKKKGFLGQVLG